MLEIGTSRGEIWPLRTLGHILHMFLDILELGKGNKKNSLGKTFVKILSHKFTKKTCFVL